MFWCVKCAKYLTFDTFERPDDSALSSCSYLENLTFSKTFIVLTAIEMADFYVVLS